MKLIESCFVSSGDQCAGTLYLPVGVEKPPVVILGHGFAALKSFRLEAFAERFVAQGYAAYCFDYRGFGESEGQPRHWVDPARHLDDWRCAIEHIRQQADIDSDKIILWGSSFGGGHVLRIAAEDHAIAAVIAQVPHVDGIATALRIKPTYLLLATFYALRDLIGGYLFNAPHYSPVLGRSGEFAAMSSDESWDGYRAMIPADSNWENRCLSRIFLKLPLYSPIYSVHKITAPTLIVAGKNDAITPASAAKKTADRIGSAEFSLLDCGHFEPYEGDLFEQNMAVQLAFLSKHI